MAPKAQKRKQKVPKKKPAVAPTPVWDMKEMNRGNKTKVQVFKPNCHRPYIMQRTVKEMPGARHARRPWKLARNAGEFNGVDVQWADAFDPPSDWSEDVEMRVETKLDDCGWRAGPTVRSLPPFQGDTPGPTDSSLDASSTVAAFVDTQITYEFRKKVVEYTHAHCLQYRKDNPNWRSDSIEQSMRKFKKKFNVKSFDLWLACRLRIAQLKPEIHAYSLWDQHSSLFDVQVFAAMTYNQYQWMNRHASFADVRKDPADSSSSSEEDQSDSCEVDESNDEPDSSGSDDDDSDVIQGKSPSRDPYRKRRELTDMACAAFGKAWNPHQHLGLDEAVRAHKHWGRQRIRFKAAVHSGALVDSLNDCTTKYCMGFEERRWIHRQESDDDPNHAITARLLRAADVLVQKSKDKKTSTANFCIAMDRGYGLVEAQEELAQLGIYSNAIMATNRTGLPRNYVRDLAKDLDDCPHVQDERGKWIKCPHDLDCVECRRYSFAQG